MSNIKDAITDKLSVKDFESLPNRLKISKTMFTRYMNNPKNMDYQTVINLGILIKIDPLQLITEYHCGIDVITMKQAIEIEQKQYEFVIN